MAFVAFAEYPIDVGVIEVGMGGEWDATNVVNGAVNVITPIGFDHMEYLGSTIEAIASTKAGIIKSGSITVLAAQEMAAAKVLLERCIAMESAPIREGIEFSLTSREIALGGQMISIDGVNGKYRDIFLPLHGLHQAHNAAVALASVEAFIGEKTLDEEVVREAFALVKSPGRLEVVLRDPTVILDAAHNPHGMNSLRETLAHEFDFTHRIAVFAPMGDKDVDGMLELMKETFDTLIVTRNSSQRALDVDRLAEMARVQFDAARVITSSDLPAALEMAVQRANERNLSEASSAAVVVTGSVVTVGEARLLMRRRRGLNS
jgi:dihydrofolate synthase/folylpolyglutamate synthase